MKGNTDKCHLLLSRNYETQLEIGDSLIRNSNSKKLLDVLTLTKKSVSMNTIKIFVRRLIAN